MTKTIARSELGFASVEYRVVSGTSTIGALESQLNQEARRGYKVITAVGNHIVLEREAGLHDAKASCPQCGTDVEVLASETGVETVGSSRIAQDICPDCGSDVYFRIEPAGR